MSSLQFGKNLFLTVTVLHKSVDWDGKYSN